jgi:hypothetical protein
MIVPRMPTSWATLTGCLVDGIAVLDYVAGDAFLTGTAG